METGEDPIIRGVVQISGDSERVTDADEEVFLLYSDLQSSVQSGSDVFRGLGHVDSRKDTMTISFELKDSVSTTDTIAVSGSRSSRRNKKQRNRNDAGRTIQIELAQDKTALRTRKGDTGSVLWKASIDFAQMILQQIHSRSRNSLLNPTLLKTQHVLELGAGTGLLAIAFSSLVQRYTVTDIKDLLPLLRKNVASNFDGWPSCAPSTPGSNVFVEELDWVILQSTKPIHRPRLVNVDPVDLLLVVDCIYHPSLLPALVETIDYLVHSERTAVLVVVELRAVDVIREFLELWMGKPGWDIWRVGDNLVEKPYAMWLGWRKDIQ
ncbi:Diaminohydroxyphosphoribosylamino-pyrimidine deaminase [Hypsizygus marmoreus]|uniref:Diaminohydroxyphosphoribosylamino-pyrimidine deaminase n=1 Tax=Hypsizygus marmoreus TaxID=39966 RepID=A0A369J406_HYPMA|nr:Diaminohydroxyphosphoribosylamino-pyrimidine deaminase [Hypsizygus marmoreus]